MKMSKKPTDITSKWTKNIVGDFYNINPKSYEFKRHTGIELEED